MPRINLPLNGKRKFENIREMSEADIVFLRGFSNHRHLAEVGRSRSPFASSKDEKKQDGN
jgi:hypothetical protein